MRRRSRLSRAPTGGRWRQETPLRSACRSSTSATARAPEALADLPAPDAIFLGGGISDATMQTALERLKPGGRLVAHSVTLESEAGLLAAHARHGGELTRLTVAHAEPLGNFSGWRPSMPVTQWAWRKP